MELRRCERGHFYDAEKYDACPHCTAETDVLQEIDAVSAESMDIILPYELGLFQVKEVLGKGRASKVFRIETKERYALKVVDITDEMAARMAENEYRISQLLNDDKHFVKYYAMYKRDGNAYFVQPELRSLVDYIRKKHPDFGHTMNILQDAAQSIVSLHEKGMIHLDIKPTNIFVDNNGNGKLGDFSSACNILDYKEKPVYGGTAKYISPEVFHKSGYSGKEDMYSFGITMYYILSAGKFPYDFSDSKTRSVESVYIDDAYIPELIQNMIKKATAFSPSDRYVNMGELLDELQSINQLAEAYQSHPSENWGNKPVYYEAERAYTSPLSSSDIPDGKSALEISKVRFSAIAPKMLIKGDYTMIGIVMYEDPYHSVVDDLMKEADVPVRETKSGLVKVKEGAKVKIQLTTPDFPIEDNVEEQEWCGEYLIFHFAVMLPEKYAKKQVLFMATVYIDDIIATRLKFIAKCWSLFQQKIKVAQEDVLSAFVSYASQDRSRVAMIVQGMQKARPDMDIFFDVESLRSGESWEEALWSEIDKRDTLFLCWSHYAKESEWVEREWRYAFMPLCGCGWRDTHGRFHRP